MLHLPINLTRMPSGMESGPQPAHANELGKWVLKHSFFRISFSKRAEARVA